MFFDMQAKWSGVDAAPENRERKIAIRDDPGKRLGLAH